MTDREKVLQALQHCPDDCSDCYTGGPGFGIACRDQLRRDALALLKEQEAVASGLMQDAKGIWNTCGKCGHILKSAFFNPMEENNTFFYYPKFCSECGQAVKWND